MTVICRFYTMRRNEMPDFNELLKKAKEMQQVLMSKQDEAEKIEVTGNSGGGLVQVVMTCRGVVKKVSIDPSLTDDVGVLEDLLVAAFNDARGKSEERLGEEMKSVTGGFGLPF